MIKFETWKSSQNNEEKHFFLVNEGTGYQPHKYVWGYNPQLISKEAAGRIELIINEELLGI